MQHTELLHRFFDEGLEESLEDVLFERMASDAELRGEFLEHLRLHSIVQEDAAGVTTPSHVSQELFTHLGLTPPDHVEQAAPTGFRKQVAALALGLRSFVVEHQRYFYTATLSSLATLLLIFGLNIGGGSHAIEDGGSDVTQSRAHDISTRSTETSTRAHTFAGTEAAAPPLRADDGGSGTIRAGFTASSSSGSQPSAIPAVMETEETADGSTQPIEVSDGVMQSATRTSSVAHDLIAARAIVLNDVPLTLPEEHVSERRWHFFQPGPRTNLLSNMVFELQKLVGASYPNVDLPHNSHTVFENMAFSAVYKVTEHHAFGFEYGREHFGREYTSTMVQTQAPLDVSVQEMFTPPASASTVQARDNRMLDIFGAVWKLSLPDYGIAHVVYPYMRTFVGATRIGPLGKVRLGLEMYPSNFSALNVGLEGGLFRYTEDDAAYYTTKLNVTFGVAIGF